VLDRDAVVPDVESARGVGGNVVRDLAVEDPELPVERLQPAPGAVDASCVIPRQDAVVEREVRARRDAAAVSLVTRRLVPAGDAQVLE
jgi:hypothetical protein